MFKIATLSSTFGYKLVCIHICILFLFSVIYRLTTTSEVFVVHVIRLKKTPLPDVVVNDIIFYNVYKPIGVSQTREIIIIIIIIIIIVYVCGP